MDDRALVHALELRVVDLTGVAQRGPGRAEAGAVRPDPRLVAGARETLGLDEAPARGSARERPVSGTFFSAPASPERLEGLLVEVGARAILDYPLADWIGAAIAVGPIGCFVVRPAG